jgi:hypothetical protein
MSKLNRVLALFAVLLLVAVVAAPAFAAETTTFRNVTLVDQDCAVKDKVKADPDGHTRNCALMCSKSGYGVFADGKYYKFDEAGSAKALAALKASSKKDHLRVDVTGELDGDTLEVTSLTLLD